MAPETPGALTPLEPGGPHATPSTTGHLSSSSGKKRFMPAEHSGQRSAAPPPWPLDAVPLPLRRGFLLFWRPGSPSPRTLASCFLAERKQRFLAVQQMLPPPHPHLFLFTFLKLLKYNDNTR